MAARRVRSELAKLQARSCIIVAVYSGLYSTNFLAVPGARIWIAFVCDLCRFHNLWASRSVLGSNRLLLVTPSGKPISLVKTPRARPGTRGLQPHFWPSNTKVVPPTESVHFKPPRPSHLSRCSPSCRSTRTLSCTACRVPKLMKYARTPIYWANLTKFIQLYLNGSDSPYQREAMENVYYWYDGNVPYCTDANAWQPLDDNFIHMNVPGYSYIDPSHHGAHQVDGMTCSCASWADFVSCRS